MEIGIVCVPFQTDMARWGMARGPQAILEAGLISRLRTSGHTVAEPVWIDFPNSERSRDTVTNLGRIAARTSAAVRAVLARDGAFALVLEGNCAHALGPMGSSADVAGASNRGQEQPPHPAAGGLRLAQLGGSLLERLLRETGCA